MGTRLRLLSSIRWYHLGYAFVWSAVFVGTSAFDTTSGYDAAYQLCQLALTIVAICVAAHRFGDRINPPSWHSIPCCTAVGFGSLLFYAAPLAGEYELALLLASAATTGAAAGYAYVMWQQFFASEGELHASLSIPLSGLLSVLLCGVLAICPLAAKVASTVAVLPALAAVSLKRSLDDIEPFHIPHQTQGPDRVGRIAAAARAFAGPILCCCAVGFSWELVLSVPSPSGEGPFWPFIAGQAAAVVGASLVILSIGERAGIVASHRVLAPFVLAVLCLACIPGIMPYALAGGALAFESEFLSFLLLYAIARYSSARELPSSPVYAACFVPVYACLWMGKLVGSIAAPVLASATGATGAIVACLYLVALTLVIPPKPSGAFGPDEAKASAVEEEAGASGDASTQDEPSAARRISRIAVVEPFSARETEVAELMARGNTVAAISRKLFISENTTRSHIKNIYRKAGIHSRQEFVDALGEAETPASGGAETPNRS